MQAAPCCRWRCFARHAPLIQRRSGAPRQHRQAPPATSQWLRDEPAGCVRSARARRLVVKWPSTSPRSIAAMILLSLQTMSSTSWVKGIDWLVVGGRCLVSTCCADLPASRGAFELGMLASMPTVLPAEWAARTRRRLPPAYDRAAMKPFNQTSLHHFDELPDSAFVRLPVVVALLGVSPSTVWRWSRLGRLPAPVKIAGTTLWNVGLLRHSLSFAAPDCSVATSLQSNKH